MPVDNFTQLDYKNRAFLQKFVEAGEVYSLMVDTDGVITLTPLETKEESEDHREH